MTREDIIRMAREANISVFENNSFADDLYISVLYRFASIVAAATKEKCAKLAEDNYFSAKDLAKDIRALGDQK
jgi:hypothetical protein